jgi:AcrR family transcriptional regulator
MNKAQRRIRESFIKLVSKKDIEDITVEEIIENAEVARSTFYKYYPDKYHIAYQLINRLNSIYLDNLLQMKTLEEFRVTAEEIYVDRDIYCHLYSNSDSSESLVSYTTRDLIEKTARRISPDPLDEYTMLELRGFAIITLGLFLDFTRNRFTGTNQLHTGFLMIQMLSTTLQDYLKEKGH